MDLATSAARPPWRSCLKRARVVTFVLKNAEGGVHVLKSAGAGMLAASLLKKAEGRAKGQKAPSG